MVLKKLLTFSAILLSHFLYGQDTISKVIEIDKFVSGFDSCEKAAVNIGYFIEIKYSDSDTTRLYNRYILDTVKRHFYKCVYDCSFNGPEEITFYFIDRELIKVQVKIKKDTGAPFNATYYFDKGINIYKKESKNSNLLWGIEKIKAQAKKYLDDIAGVIAFLDKTKRLQVQ